MSEERRIRSATIEKCANCTKKNSEIYVQDSIAVSRVIRVHICGIVKVRAVGYFIGYNVLVEKKITTHTLAVWDYFFYRNVSYSASVVCSNQCRDNNCPPDCYARAAQRAVASPLPSSTFHVNTRRRLDSNSPFKEKIIKS